MFNKIYFCLLLPIIFIQDNDVETPEPTIVKSKLYSCCQPVKYNIETMRFTDGRELAQKIVLTVDPQAKKIHLKAIDANKEFDTQITESTCTLNPEMTEGKAVYSGFVIQADGSRSMSTISIEATPCGIKISESDPSQQRKTRVHLLVSSWDLR